MRLAQTLFASNELKIDFFPSPENTEHYVAFTFTPFVAEAESTLEGSGYAGDFLLEHGFDVVAFKSSKNFWYQNISPQTLDDVQRFLAAMEPQYLKRVGYGSSMGGYAAIQFSNALKLDVVLALSPQFEIDQPYDQRWALPAKKIVFQHRINQASIHDRCKYFIAHDPRSLDTAHVEKLRALVSPKLFFDVNIPFAGHPVSYYLAETGLIQELALSTLKFSNVDSIDIKANRRRSKTYLYELSKQLSEQEKNKSALTLINKAILLDESVDEFYLQRCIVLKALGQAELSIDEARILATRPIQNTYLLGPLAELMAQLGDLEAALEVVNRALTIDRNMAELHWVKSLICEGLGSLDEAMLAASHAHTTSPKNIRVVWRLVILNLKKGRLRSWATAGKHSLNALRLLGRKLILRRE